MCTGHIDKKLMPINKCRKDIEQGHHLKYMLHEEGNRNTISRRKEESMRNEGVQKVKDSMQQKK
jgi:hypothetical protein